MITLPKHRSRGPKSLPKTSAEHEFAATIYQSCPRCGMSWSDYIKAPIDDRPVCKPTARGIKLTGGGPR